jgi:hypothetical protein
VLEELLDDLSFVEQLRDGEPGRPAGRDVGSQQSCIVQASDACSQPVYVE